MTREEKYQYLARFLAGELEGKELDAFSLWLDADNEHRNLLEEAMAVWEASDTTATPPKTLKSWNKLRQKINPAKKSNWWLRAAMILVLIGCGLWFFNQETVPEINLMVYETAVGETKEIILADSSLVVLSPESKLVVSYPWKEERKMEFLGHAYFKVTADKSRPFKVGTPEGEVRVLGTAFFVDTRTEERLNLIAVAEGKVRFSNKEDKASVDIPIGFALPNSLAKKEALVPLNQLDSYWINHSLMYANESVAIVLKDLEKIYKCAFKLKNPDVGNCKFSGKFKENNLEEILDVLAFALDITINKTAGNQIEIIGKGCPQ